jgi:hypothetical protein
MVPRTPPTVAAPTVLSSDWKTLIQLASTWIKSLDLDAYPHAIPPRRLHPPVSFIVQPTNRSPLGFEAQSKKLSRWFWVPNHQTDAADFEPQTRKLATTSYETKPGETVTIGFEAKPGETVTTSFDAKPKEIISGVLRSNYWQTVDLGFEPQSRNSCSSSPYARYRPHTASPDFSIIQS